MPKVLIPQGDYTDLQDLFAGLAAYLPSGLVLSASLLSTLAERRVHGYNYAFLKAIGGEELLPKEMARYYRLQALLPFLAWGSSLLLPKLPISLGQMFAGLGLIVFATMLRIWATRSLGRLWSLACVYVPGMPRYEGGLYRHFRHPEYGLRALEGFGFLLFFGVNALSMVLWFWLCREALRLSKTESRQLYELSVAPLQMREASSTFGGPEETHLEAKP